MNLKNACEELDSYCMTKGTFGFFERAATLDEIAIDFLDSRLKMIRSLILRRGDSITERYRKSSALLLEAEEKKKKTISGNFSAQGMFEAGIITVEAALARPSPEEHERWKKILVAEEAVRLAQIDLLQRAIEKLHVRA